MSWLTRDFRANFDNPARWAWGGWLALTVALFAYVLRHGRDTPMWEEWYDLDGLYGVTSPFDWVFGRLNQHRYVVGRATMYALFHATGGDFRAGLFVSVGLLSAATAVVLGTLRQLRGRSHGIDGIVPLLLMNPGASENLLLGYQMHFTIDVLLIAVFVRCVALADVWPPGVTAWRVSVLTALLALGGWVGLAFVPGATAWVALLIVRGRRRDALALVVPLLACGFFAWSYVELQRNPVSVEVPNGGAAMARVVGEFYAMTFSNLGPPWWPVSGVLAVLSTAALGATQVSSLGRSPGRRAVAVGVLAVVFAVAMMAYGTGKMRPVGFAVRNIPLLAFLPILAVIHGVKFVGPVRHRVELAATAVAVALALTVHVRGWIDGEKAGSAHRTKYDRFAADRDAGMPLEFLVSRHQMFPCSEVYTGTRLLRSRGHPFARGIPDAPPYRVVPLTVTRPANEAVPGDPDGEWVVGTPPVWRLDAPSRQHVAGVRVKLRYPRACERIAIQLMWRKADGTTGVSVCMPWLTPNDWTLDFWVDGIAAEFWLRPMHQADAFELLSAELLTAQG